MLRIYQKMAFLTGVAGACVAGMCLSRYMNDADREIEFFIADWCPHCRSIHGEMQKLVDDREGYAVTVYEEGTGAAEKMQKKRGVQSFPTIILKKGSSVKKYAGARTYEAIKEAILNM